MQYLLTEEELDAQRNYPRLTAKEFLCKLMANITPQKVCVDILVGSVWVIPLTDFKAAVEKTIEHYAPK